MNGYHSVMRTERVSDSRDNMQANRPLTALLRPLLGDVWNGRVQEEEKEYNRLCEEAFTAAKQQTELNNKLWLDSPWKQFSIGPRDPTRLDSTGVSADTIDHILRVFSSDPPDPQFNLHAGMTAANDASPAYITLHYVTLVLIVC